MKRQVFLIGLPGAGKSTLGKQLADQLRLPFVDLDQEIESQTTQSIQELFSEKGEDYFRQLEATTLHQIIAERQAFVMATGGGAPCFFDNINAMKAAGRVVYIDTPMDVIKQRLQKDTTRPLMQTHTLEGLLEKRQAAYNQADAKAATLEALLAIFKN